MHSLSITRVVNACALIEIGDQAILTDPYFDDHWYMRLQEPIGMKVAHLPRLAAIVGGHGVFDHWQPRSLSNYRYKATTPVCVATPQMKAKANAAGFCKVEVLDWDEIRKISEDLLIETAPAQVVMGRKTNNYVLNARGVRVFIGTEARDIEPLRRYRKLRPAVDVALLPIDGSALAGQKLVMNAEDAIEGARVLGAKVLIPIHFALKSIPVLLQTPGSIAKLEFLAKRVTDLEVVPTKTGERWTWTGANSMGWR
jgi:L-ascorbate metabolism protein UlaG (beta-lactamase superfamily)